jgi:hypothetical protein
MLKIMLIQRGGVTMHKVIDSATRFEDFIELVSFENFGKDVKSNRQHREVQVPHSGTTYTMLEVAEAVPC